MLSLLALVGPRILDVAGDLTPSTGHPLFGRCICLPIQMFFSQLLLAKKGALSKVWLAAVRDILLKHGSPRASSCRLGANATSSLLHASSIRKRDAREPAACA